MVRVWNFVAHYSLLLVAGAGLALIWANLDAASYHAVIDYPLLNNSLVGLPSFDDTATRTLTVHYLINDVLMALFFAIAGKEVWEAIILKDGSLRGRKSVTPLIATLGGMLGPISVYFALAWMLGPDVTKQVARGWAIPTATDIAFSYLVGRIVFGAGHPAVTFLLLLAIADDAGGLIILAVFYPTAALAPLWLLVSFAAAITAYMVFNWGPRWLDASSARKPVATWVRKKLSFWPYVLAGVVSWYGFQKSGIHPALGLLPIIPAIPHSDREFGLFAEAELALSDLLNTIEHALKAPVQIILFAFGFANAGVEFSSIGAATWLVLAGLIVGKPVGILFFGWLSAGPLGFGLPKGMQTKDLFVVGCVAAIGFTVALFVASVAFAPGNTQDAAKMGALLSLASCAIAIAAGRLLRIEKVESR